MTRDDDELLSEFIYSGNAMVKVGDDILFIVAHIVTSVLTTSHHPLTFRSVLHVRKLQHNLLSVRQLCGDNNCNVVLSLNVFMSRTTQWVISFCRLLVRALSTPFLFLLYLLLFL